MRELTRVASAGLIPMSVDARTVDRGRLVHGWILQVTLALLLALPGSAAAQVGDAAIVPVSDTFRGVTVLSQREKGNAGPGSDRYFLVQEARPGEYVRLPIPPRLGVPFDIDLGPGLDGDVTAVYSRCDSEPDPDTVRGSFGSRIFSDPYPAYTAGGRCDIYRYDLATQQEMKIQGASTSEGSEVLPSIWRDNVAFARVYEQRDGRRGVYPYLYVRPLDGGRSDRQPGGSRGTEGLPGPTRLDLYGRRLSFVWNYATRESSPAGITEVRLDTVGGRHRVLSQAEHGGDEAYASYLGPNGYRGYIFYGFARADIRREPEFADALLLLNERIATGERDVAGGKLDGYLIDLATDSETTFVGLNSNVFGYSEGNGYTRKLGLREYTDSGY